MFYTRSTWILSQYTREFHTRPLSFHSSPMDVPRSPVASADTSGRVLVPDSPKQLGVRQELAVPIPPYRGKRLDHPPGMRIGPLEFVEVVLLTEPVMKKYAGTIAA